jgi:uncharacterized RDD family membrane protein YckC
MADVETRQTASRAGFWRRILAILIDVALCALVVTVAGVFLFGLTDGRIRVGTALIDVNRCIQVDPQRIEVPLPPQFQVTSALQCTKSFFGIVHDRTLRVAQVTRSGSTTYTRAITYPVDADGRPTRAFYIDYLTWILLVAYVLLLEWRCGQTLGKRVMRIRVKSLRGGPITLAQAIKRSVIRFLPWPLFWLPFMLPLMFGENSFFAFATSDEAMVLILIMVIAMLIFLGNFAQRTRRHELPWHDRWAATEVVHD